MTIDQKLMRKQKTQSEIGADAVVATLWFALYLIAIAVAVISPLLLNAVNVAAR